MAVISQANANITDWHGASGATDEPPVEALRQQVNTKCLGGTALTINVMDDDSAASNGTDLFFVPQTGVLGSFYSANAGTAHSLFEDAANGEWWPVFYNADPATNLGGIAVYFDEDGTAGGRFQIVSPFNKDHYAMSSAGKLLKVADNDDAATDGVAVHFDDDAAGVDDRLLFISPTDTAGSDTTQTGIAAMTGTA